MKPTRTWIVIADGARACFLENRGPGSGLAPAGAPELSQELKPTREIGAEPPGRTHDRLGPGRHAMAPRVDWHEFEKVRFAKEIASLLDRSAEAKAFDRLVLVAPPKILGTLRAELGKNTAAMVSGELAKDLTNHPLDALPAHLADTLAL